MNRPKPRGNDAPLCSVAGWLVVLFVWLATAALQSVYGQATAVLGINPSSAAAGGASFTLTVDGAGFVAPTFLRSGTTVNWNAVLLATTFVSSTELTASVPGSFLSAPGTASITVVNTDGTRSNAVAFTIRDAVALTIATSSPLLAGEVATAYSQTFAASGGAPPYVWSLAGGSLPPGLTLSSAGTLSGIPTAAGTVSFSLQVKDSTSVQAQKDFSLTIDPPPLEITTGSPLPGGSTGSAYSQTLAASGGTPPYVWSLAGGSLPLGLMFAPGGIISGNPATAGTFYFTVQVTDSARIQTSKAFAISIGNTGGVSQPQVILGGLPATLTPAQQVKLDLHLNQGYPFPIQGTVNLSFAPDAVNQADDAAIQFSTGGRSVSFTIPANGTQAVFPAPEEDLQTGTVAGAITLTVKMQSDGTDITPSPVPTLTAQVSRLAPQLTNVSVARTSTGFKVVITGLSTPREVTGATFQFTAGAGANLQTTEFSVDTTAAFQAWYQQASSAQFGSQFVLTQPFTVQGDSSLVNGVSVSLVNSSGTSNTGQASF